MRACDDTPVRRARTAPISELVTVVGEPTRARILAELGQASLCTCHLVEVIGAKQTSISNHLRILREAGLIDAVPAGRYTYYQLRSTAAEALAEHYAALARSSRTAERKPC